MTIYSGDIVQNTKKSTENAPGRGSCGKFAGYFLELFARDARDLPQHNHEEIGDTGFNVFKKPLFTGLVDKMKNLNTLIIF